MERPLLPQSAPPRSDAWIAYLFLALAFAQTALSGFFASRNGLTLERLFAEFLIALMAAALAFSVVGALIVLRRPENAIGWLFCGAGFFAGLLAWFGQYARYALVTRAGALPASDFVNWVNYWVWIPVLSIFVLFLPLLFPDGRLPSPRWRPAFWLAVSVTILLSVTMAITPDPIDSSVPQVPNPFAPPGAETTLRILTPVAVILLLFSLAAAVCAPLARLRRASGVEFQQIKWFAYAAAMMALSFLVPAAVNFRTFTQDTLLSGVLLSIALPFLPAAVGIAILRHRLFDIDIIIRRTLVYGLLTGTLALVYFGGVVAFQRLLQWITNTASPLAVVFSTLVIAALFNPLRRRIQSIIDRRFYRGKYDAQQALAAFAASARDEVDTERLSDALLSAVEETIHPTSAALWLVTKREK